MTRANVCIAIIFLSCLVAVSGCAGVSNDALNSSAHNSLPQDKYVAIHEDLHTTATIVEGSYGHLPHITPPSVFVYDGSPDGADPMTGCGWSNLDGYYPAVNDSFVVLYGTSYYRDVAPSDTSTGVRVRGIYSLPATLQSGFVLQGIDRDGTVRGSYNNTLIVLKAGERWSTPVATEVKAGNGTGRDQKPFAYKARYDTTWTIANMGVFDKANLTRYNNSATGIGYVNVYMGADPAM